MNKAKGICKLCLHERVFVNAHIIPESFYKKLYNDQHQFTDARERDEVIENKRRRKGIRDNSILCSECDRLILGRLDDYAAKVFWGYRNLDIQINEYHDKNDPRIRWRVANNVNTETLKVFFLSILLRADVTKNSFFEDVSLGSAHNSALRRLFLITNQWN